MRIPGFNAEASLRRTNEYYLAADYDQSGGVLPARLTLNCGCDPNDSDCIHCCKCIRAGGHPNRCCF